MRLTIEVWRQDGPEEPGRWETHELDGLTPQESLLDVIDLLNDRIVDAGGEPVAYESDCREGICGACGVQVNGVPHGPVPRTPSCRQHLRSLGDTTHLRLEPLRSAAFPVVRDLVVDRSALDRVITAGGHVGVTTGTAPDADALPVTGADAERALDLAACIGCGACVAACPNGSAHLFAGSKLAHLALLPQPSLTREPRSRAVLEVLEAEFGPCSTFGECAQVCPAGIDLAAVAAVHRERLRGMRRGD